MVILLVKRGDENQFLYETDVEKEVDEVVKEITAIFNGRLKVTRICYEFEELWKHGTFLPPEMQGLNEDQVRMYFITPLLIVYVCVKCIKPTGHMMLSDHRRPQLKSQNR